MALLVALALYSWQTGLDFYPDLPKEVQDRIEMPRADRLW